MTLKLKAANCREHTRWRVLVNGRSSSAPVTEADEATAEYVIIDRMGVLTRISADTVVVELETEAGWVRPTPDQFALNTLTDDEVEVEAERKRRDPILRLYQEASRERQQLAERLNRSNELLAAAGIAEGYGLADTAIAYIDHLERRLAVYEAVDPKPDTGRVVDHGWSARDGWTRNEPARVRTRAEPLYTTGSVEYREPDLHLPWIFGVVKRVKPACAGPRTFKFGHAIKSVEAVYVDGNELTPASYSVDLAAGKIRFNETFGGVITVDATGADKAARDFTDGAVAGYRVYDARLRLVEELDAEGKPVVTTLEDAVERGLGATRIGGRAPTAAEICFAVHDRATATGGLGGHENCRCVANAPKPLAKGQVVRLGGPKTHAPWPGRLDAVMSDRAVQALGEPEDA